MKFDSNDNVCMKFLYNEQKMNRIMLRASSVIDIMHRALLGISKSYTIFFSIMHRAS